jgi:hypothetical protein
MNPRVKEVKYSGNYKLVITFENDEVKLFDVSPYLIYPVYEPLKNDILCSKAKVTHGTVAWNDIIDFDPDTLYLEGK